MTMSINILVRNDNNERNVNRMIYGRLIGFFL